MRLHILSDLHLEFEGYTPDRTKADVVILAGDIDVGSKGIQWAKRQFPKQPVIYIMGNHEFYGHTMPTLLAECRAETQGTNIHLLENQSVQIGDLTFLGCTLWTDFKLWPKPADAMEAARDYMSDFRLIKTSSGRLHPKDTVQLHRASLDWLKAELERSDPAKTVIITHHAPSVKSTPPEFAHDVMNGAFVSDLEALIRQSRVPLWIHGHTHYCVNYTIGRTVVFSNQRGYPAERKAQFNAGAIIEL